jgi:ABC-type multidrug transport system fused ATPase/permease subunit
MPSFNPLQIVKFSMNLLPGRDRRLLTFASLFQIALSFLDLVGIALIGILGSLSVNGVQSRDPGNRVTAVLKFLQLQDQSFQSQVAVLGVLASTVFISRTLLSVFFSRRTMFFLSRRGANISSNLVSRLLNQSYLGVNARTAQETIFALTSGVTVLTLVVIGGLISLLADLSLLIVLTIGLMLVDYKLAIATFLLFAGIALTLYLFLHKRVHTLGNSQASLGITISEDISEAIASFRENLVRGRRSYYVNKISSDQVNLASVQAEISFLPNISKYVIEASLVIGTLVICGFQFAFQDATRAVGTLSIFLAAGSRIAPAVLRIQQSALAFKNAGGIAGPTIELIRSLENVAPLLDQGERVPDFEYATFSASVCLENVNVSYPGTDSFALKDVSLIVHQGETVAIVGPSGAGKTTLVDVILGVLEPTSGSVIISGKPPREAIDQWPGAVAYVPQDVAISNKSLKENITLGFNERDLNQDTLENAIEIAQLKEFIASLYGGGDSVAGERGTKLSGGQRQRLGIARALYTSPKLLVLDEATSALDGQTEVDISNSIQSLKGRVTVILIAHRLSTILNADRIYYVDKGKIVASGTFSELRSIVPNFDIQAKLMGLN